MAIPGSVVNVGKLVTPGGAQGQSGPSAVSADPGNIAVLGSDNLILVPQSTIWSQRLRSFNAIGNPNFEVDQRNIHAGLVNPVAGTFLLDRFYLGKVGTMTVNTANPILSNPRVVPGTNFAISSSQLGLSLQTQQTTLGASDYLYTIQIIEGSNWRELCADVSSLSLLVYSTVAPLKFSVAIRDSPATQSLVKLCTITNAATWTLIQLPNIPVPPSGNFSLSPGVTGYTLTIVLAAGSNFVAPAADVWNAGNFLAAPGADNFASKPVNSGIYFSFVQHEPGPLCTTLIDKPFSQNLDECLRYYQKSYDYALKPGVASPVNGASQAFIGTGRLP